jgi:fimbrial chaperone protein
MRLQKPRSAVAAVRFAGVLAAVITWSTAAPGLTVSPVLVELSPARRVASITLSNPGDHAISFQTQTMTWTQPEGVDRYEPTAALIVVPPIAEIAAGGSQIFRVTTRVPPGTQEQAYRLIFEDVTEVAAPAPAAGESSINIRVNHDLPVFIAAPGKRRAQSRLGPCSAPAATATQNNVAKIGPAMQQLCVRLDNDGNHYAQVKSLTVSAADWKQNINAPSRVLAGAWRQWTFEAPSAIRGPLQVTAETADGPVTMELQLPAH